MVRPEGKTDNKDLDILIRNRALAAPEAETLESIALEYGITRERVRQLRAGAERRAQMYLSTHTVRSIRECCRILNENGGLLSLEQLAEKAEEVCTFDRIRALNYIPWVVSLQPHQLFQFVRGRRTVFAVQESIGEHRLLQTLNQLHEHLQQEESSTLAGLVSVLSTSWPDLPEAIAKAHQKLLIADVAVQMLPGIYASAEWGRGQWARYVLEEAGEPLHFREIAYRVNSRSGRSFSDTGFNSILNEDPAFVRVGAGDFAMASWGALRYGRFNEIILYYLSAQPTIVHEEQVINDLLRTYTVTATTVRAMLATHREMFRHYGIGYWGLVGREYEGDPTVASGIAEAMAAAGEPMPIESIIAAMPATPSTAVIRSVLLDKRFCRVGTGRPLFSLRP